MKKTLMIAAAAAAMAAPAFGEVEYEIGTGYSSQYNFRGVDFGDDLVETSLTATFDAGDFDITVGAWYADFDESAVGSGTSDELDLFISAATDVNIFGIDGTVEFGFTQYLFQQNTSLQTNEVFVGLSTSYAGFDFGVTYFYDLDLIEGSYLEATVGKTFEINECVNAEIEVGVAYSDEYTNLDSGLNHYWVALALPYAFRENAVLTPFIKFIQVEDAVESFNRMGRPYEQDDEVIGGVNLSVAF